MPNATMNGDSAWGGLWSDFAERADRVTSGAKPRDIVDITILWQIRGYTCYVPRPIQAEALHLPELYSGSPWIAGKPWIAFVTINPSIDPDELFPDLVQFRRCRDNLKELVSYFDERFEATYAATPLPHGRSGGRPTVWRGTIESPAAHHQPTWRQIENGLRDCLSKCGRDSGSAILGTVAAIIDAVPWKFAKWACVLDKWKKELLEFGAPYLRRTLESHPECPPAAVIACGLNQDLLPEGHALLSTNDRIRIGEREVPLLRLSAPTAHGNAFSKEILAKAGEIGKVLAA